MADWFSLPNPIQSNTQNHRLSITYSIYFSISPSFLLSFFHVRASILTPQALPTCILYQLRTRSLGRMWDLRTAFAYLTVGAVLDDEASWHHIRQHLIHARKHSFFIKKKFQLESKSLHIYFYLQYGFFARQFGHYFYVSFYISNLIHQNLCKYLETTYCPGPLIIMLSVWDMIKVFIFL